MKNAFLTALLLASVSAASLVVELFGAISISIPALMIFAGGAFTLGVLLLAIADYAPRRRSQLGRAARRTIRRENAAPDRAAHSATAWGYRTLSA